MAERADGDEPRDRAVDADTTATASEDASERLDWRRVREDLDAVVDQDPTPRT